VIVAASASVWERLTAADVALAVVNQLKRPGSVTADQLANGILRSVDPTLVTSAAVLTCILRYGRDCQLESNAERLPLFLYVG
jgi:hypothetical protein